MARVLVLDGHSNAALAFVRSIARAGHWVAVGSGEGARAYASLSRYCRQSIEYPDPISGIGKFYEVLLKLIRENQFDLIVPITDWTTGPLSKERELFLGVTRD